PAHAEALSRLTEIAPAEPAAAEPASAEALADDTQAALREADVLARYGLKDRAIERLLALSRRQPADLVVRERLVELMAEIGNPAAPREAESLAEAYRRRGHDSLAAALFARLGLSTAVRPEPVRPAPPAPAGASPSPPFEVEFDEFDVPPAPAAQPIAAPVVFDSFGEPGGVPAPPDLAGTQDEASLQEIFREFRKGVEQQLSAEDYETHYNLGIAYKEMGLLDEAIGEFQLASKAPALTVECCSLLGLCFLEKGMPQLAIKWYGKGLATPGIRETDTAGLLYDLAKVYQDTGDMNLAYS